MREHELRRQVVEEMHLRRWPELPASGEILQIIRAVSQEERHEEFQRLVEALQPGSDRPAEGDRHIAGNLATGVQFAWERHTEGSSLALFAGGADASDRIEAQRAWLEDFPGAAVRATRILLVEDGDAASATMGSLGFNSSELVSSRLGTGVQFWTDFRIHDRGYGRVLVAANGCDPVALSRSVQQLQELGNYRNLALLALPVVREQWTKLDDLEASLRSFAADVSDPENQDDTLLDKVSGLSLELTNLTNRISYRLDATKAYAELVEERLDGLAPERVEGCLSLREFTRRRFLPAVRTCAAHRDRLQRLSERAADMTALLRARIETRIENQNARLLESMDRNSQRQLRLQQLVEGFSIFALTYYGIGLLGYVLEALEHVVPLGSHDLIKGIAVPVLMVCIWSVVHVLKHRILRKE